MLDHLESLFLADDAQSIWARHLARMDSFGFDRCLYGVTRYLTADSFGPAEDFMILGNLPQDFVDGFVGRGLYLDAPMVAWAAENHGAQSWAWATRRAHALTQAQRTAMEFGRGHGLTAGYTVSFRDITHRTRGAIGLAARPGLTQTDADAIWAEHGREIVLSCNVMHLRLTGLPVPLKRRLTRRQREVLEWTGDGKTVQDIAQIMELRPVTVEKHLRLARETLAVETTAQAVLKAWFQNQIFIRSRQVAAQLPAAQ